MTVTARGSKKATTKKKAGKTRKPTLAELPHAEALKRLKEIYSAGRRVAQTEAAANRDKLRAKGTKEIADAAKADLAKLIAEQQLGPGPLFTPPSRNGKEAGD